MRTLRIYSLNNLQICRTSSVNYSHHVVHCTPSNCLVTESSYLLIAFMQFPLLKYYSLVICLEYNNFINYIITIFFP